MTRNAPLTDEMLARLEGLERAHRRRDQQLGPERDMRTERLTNAARWSHKNEGTPETHEHAARTRQGPLARLFMSGGLSVDQLAYAVEIASVAEYIQRDVSPGIVSYEPRIDAGVQFKRAAQSIDEPPNWVRRQFAYTIWRERLPQPKAIILDMIVGDPVPFTVAAKRYRMHNRRARRMLIDALDAWPAALEIAEADIEAARAAIY